VKRRLTLTYLLSAATTCGLGCVAILATTQPYSPHVEALESFSGNGVEVLNEYVVVHSPAPSTVAPPATTSTTTSPPLVADDPLANSVDLAVTSPPTRDIAAASTEPVVAADHPAEPTGPAEPVEPADPTPPAQSEPAAVRPSPPAAPEPTASSDTAAPAERPPIPEGCIEPEFRNGEWQCDDD